MLKITVRLLNGTYFLAAALGTSQASITATSPLLVGDFILKLIAFIGKEKRITRGSLGGTRAFS